ncbi:hypothetical protein [Dyella sp.]|uniref:hypothetical protein n=1 Tax=Dyella sp. TaxID=1869338 RepID=UPI00284DAC62|nr:hypothetical protein [Dyella sp.]MDR3446021.1 hypothetical protein [Dyella sp.]
MAAVVVPPPPPVAMPAFADACSCRVWAVDGWQSEPLSLAMGHRIEAWQATYDPYMEGLTQEGRLRAIDELSTTQLVVHPRITICGYFSNLDDTLPEHMWLIHRNFMYDTIPGWPIVRKPLPAGADGHCWPGCVRAAFPPANVFCVRTYMTINHETIMNPANFTADGTAALIATYPRFDLDPGELAYFPP